MNQESKRTLIYVVLAVVALFIAFKSDSATKLEDLSDFAKVGTEFYENFTDPTAATSLKLVSYDEAKASVSVFSVVFKEGAYRIPSHNDYPADAEDQLAETAASLIGLKREALAGRRESEHVRYGVLAPLEGDNTELEGRGNRITITNEKDEILADYIVGKAVEGAQGQYYVRHPEEKETYKVKLKINLSTRFSDWVEKDLLKLSQTDLRNIEINRYSINKQTGAVTQDVKSDLARENSGADWTLAGFESETDQVSQDKVRSIVTTLDNLELLGVRPKPPGINAKIEIDQAVVKNQGMLDLLVQDMAASGFYVAPGEDQEMYLFADQGEMTLGSADGLEYTLRFGELFAGSLQEIEAGFLSGGKKEESKKADVAEEKSEEGKTEEPKSEDGEKGDEQPEEEKKEAEQQGRYLFVSVDFKEELLGPIPTKPTKPVKAPEEQKPATAEKPEAAAKEKTEEEKPEEQKSEEVSPEEAAYQAAIKKYEEDLKKYEADLKARETKIEEGQKKAKENNDRFASWYYVIANDSFKELQVPAEELTEAKGEDKAGNGPPGGPQGLPPGLNLQNLNIPGQ